MAENDARRPIFQICCLTGVGSSARYFVHSDELPAPSRVPATRLRAYSGGSEPAPSRSAPQAQPELDGPGARLGSSPIVGQLLKRSLVPVAPRLRPSAFPALWLR